jgi:hypothetical protein
VVQKTYEETADSIMPHKQSWKQLEPCFITEHHHFPTNLEKLACEANQWTNKTAILYRLKNIKYG